MKKFITGLLIASFTIFIAAAPIADAKAQTTKTAAVHTITGADTVTFTNVPSKIKAFQYTYDETSGTSAGTVKMYGTINGEWVYLDSLALADQAAAQTKVFTLTATTYLSYRFINSNTSSATGTVKVGYLRRQDE